MTIRAGRPLRVSMHPIKDKRARLRRGTLYQERRRQLPQTGREQLLFGFGSEKYGDAVDALAHLILDVAGDEIERKIIQCARKAYWKNPPSIAPFAKSIAYSEFVSAVVKKGSVVPRQVMGFPSARLILASHFPGSCSQALIS
jgi:hypothetical protein